MNINAIILMYFVVFSYFIQTLTLLIYYFYDAAIELL